ncbi:MAG TPA: AMP-binding protein [Candidatus Acidoferrales bacterium]|jgi:2,3-dihydroxybenzoate-AMP ligase|nr:AMP-binding protein [Candidatus Acidoferrales bacterium]
MLEGVVPFPPEYAQRYRERGYWVDKSLAQEFADVFKRYADRVAIIDRDRSFTYADIDRLTDNLALNLLQLGFKPLDRVVVQLPNVAEFVILYFALQKIGAIPIAALTTHRYAEISQFVALSGAVACVVPDRQGDFEYPPMIERIRKDNPQLTFGIVLGKTPDGFLSLTDLISKHPTLPKSALAEVRIEPTDPAIFQLSGGTTGIPKLIPRTHNDYAYNSKVAAEVCEIKADSILLLILPIAHNLPLACPGIQGFFFKGGKVVLSTSTKPEDICSLIEKHRVTHIKVVPALLIRVLNDPAVTQHDLSSLQIIQSGGQRLQPETRMLAKRLIPSAFIQENFGMSEGLLTFVRLKDRDDVRLETVGTPVCPDDEVRLVDDDDNVVPFGEVGEMCCRGPYTLRGYYGVPDYNARVFSKDGFYHSGDLMRQHPSGAFIVEGRKKDLINRGGEKISAEEIENLILSHPAVKNVACIPVPDPDMGERMCACILLRDEQNLTFDEMKKFLMGKEIAKFKLPERMEILQDFPLSTFGKVSKKKLVEMISEKMKSEKRSGTSA